MRLFGLFKGKKKDPAPASDEAAVDETTAPSEAAGQDDQPRLGAGLEKTRSRMGGGLRALFGGRALDDDLIEQIEEELLLADTGIDATRTILETLRREAKRARTTTEVRDILRRTLVDMLVPRESEPSEPPPGQPWVMLVVGVNGSVM